VEIDVQTGLTAVAGGVAAPAAPLRLGVVSFVNTLPLIEGLEKLRGVELRTSVPSLLLDLLLAREVDAALCSSIDYQRSPEPLIVLPAGLLGCEGSTLTVRLSSREPVEHVREVYCDTDSHTSVALLRILLAERYGIAPRLIDYDAREQVAEGRPVESPPAVLLIGDKVVTDSPGRDAYPHQVDLGQAWSEATGLPFVFALWMARRDGDHDRLRLASAILDRARRANRGRLGGIVHRRARSRGWPADLAAAYLGRHIAFEFTPAMLEGLAAFYEKAHAHGLIGPPRELVVLET
jgi:chorismate dehydratase